MTRPKKEPEDAVIRYTGDDWRPDDLEDPVVVSHGGFTFLLRFRLEQGRFEVWSVEVARVDSRRGPRRITGTNLRLPWATIIDKGLKQLDLRLGARAANTLPEDRDPRFDELGFPPHKPRTPAERLAILSARSKLPALDTTVADRTPQRGRPRKHDLAKVAELYREGLTVNRKPTTYVAKKMRVSQDHAGKLVQEARKQGFLEPAPGRGKAGIAKQKGKKR